MRTCSVMGDICHHKDIWLCFSKNGYVYPVIFRRTAKWRHDTQGFSWILLCSCGDGADSGIYSGNGEYGEGTEKCIEPQSKKRDTEKYYQ